MLLPWASSALQTSASDSFARRNVLSSAASADRDFGSGSSGADLEHWGSSAILADHRSIFTTFDLVRIGEASNPGPGCTNMLTVGVSNPGGFRQKEELMLEFPHGIWSMVETQLSETTCRTCAGILRSKGQQQGRLIRPLFGAPAPLRHGSSWAGKWTGVATIADFPSMQLDVPWPPEHYSMRRAESLSPVTGWEEFLW